MPRTWYSKVMRNLLDMQSVLVKDTLDPKTTPAARAQVARAWDVLEERKRLLKMKPKPKDVDVEVKPRRGVKIDGVAFTEEQVKAVG